MSNVTVERRSFLNWFTDLLMAIIGLLVAIPAVGCFWAPLLKTKDGGEEAGFQDVRPLADIPNGTWSLRTLEVVQADGWKKTRVRHFIWVRRQGEGEKGITVLSPICPHLGSINWHTDQGKFICPCHGGVFDADGRNVGGPPPRGMPTESTGPVRKFARLCCRPSRTSSVWPGSSPRRTWKLPIGFRRAASC